MINEYDLTLFVKEPSGLYRKEEENHFQRAYSLETIRELVKKSGLKLLHIYDAFTHEPAREESGAGLCDLSASGRKMTKKKEKRQMKDYIVRATAAEGQIRAFPLLPESWWRLRDRIINTSPVATAALGRLLSAGAMMGVMMKGEKDVLTLQIRCNGPIGGLTVTADSHGNVKGFVENPDVMLPPNAKGKLDVGGALDLGFLSVIKDLGLKEPYVGQTELKTGEIAEDLTYYFANSEQVPSSVGLGVLMEKDNTVRQQADLLFS